MKFISKFLLFPITLGLLSTVSPIITHADSFLESVVSEQESTTTTFVIFNQKAIVVGEPATDITVTENYLTVEGDSQNSVLRAAPKTIKVSGSMVFDKQGWGYGPPKSRNWKEKRHSYWYYDKLYLQSYKFSGNLWIAQYSGTLTR